MKCPTKSSGEITSKTTFLQVPTYIDSNHKNIGSHQEKEHKREEGKTSEGSKISSGKATRP